MITRSQTRGMILETVEFHYQAPTRSIERIELVLPRRLALLLEITLRTQFIATS